MKKLISIVLCFLLITVIFVLPASANNHTDANFEISITSTSTTRSNVYVRRAKLDNSSTYVNYTKLKDGITNASGPYKFVAVIYGSATTSSSLVDCTSYVHNSSGTVVGYRTPAVVTRGTVGLIRQDVYEMFGYNSYGQIFGRAYSNSYTGTARGCWSVDSVGSSYNY